MGKEVVLMKSEEPMSAAQVAAFLADLSEKVEQGRVTLRQGGEELVLDLPQGLVLEIKVEEEEKGGKQARAKGKTRLKKTLEVEIEWYEGEEGSGGIELG